MSSLNSRPALPIFGLGCSCWAPCAMASGAPLILGTRLLETSIRRNLLKHACGNSFPAEFGSVQQPQSHPNARRAVGNYQRRQSLKKCGIICEQKVVAGGGGGFCFSEVWTETLDLASDVVDHILRGTARTRVLQESTRARASVSSTTSRARAKARARTWARATRPS